MIVRISRAKVDPSRMIEYERHENQSLFLLLKQKGFTSVLFARGGDECATIALWDDTQAVEVFVNSAPYVETQKKLRESGMLMGDESVELLEVKGGYVRPTEAMFEAPTPE